MPDKAWEIQKLLKEKYDGEKTTGFFADCTRLEQGEPLAYVIGHIPFLNTTIYLDSHPLIPRPETEYWVEKTADAILKSNALTPRILDLCAGSGCIGVAVLKAVPDASVDFAEIDERHHATIQKNIEMNAIERTRTRIHGGNLFEQLNGTYNHIFSNPPYIDPERDRLEASVRAHEPSEALYGGYGGLELIESIVSTAPEYLARNGTVFIEHEPEQTKAIGSLGNEHGFVVRTEIDQYGLERYSQLTRKS